MPLQTYGSDGRSPARPACRVGAEHADARPAGSSTTATRDAEHAPIERSFVIGDRLYTLSYLGLSRAALDDLGALQATRPFKEGRRGARRRGSSGRRGYEGRGRIERVAANQCVLPPAHAITAKSAAAAMARRVGRVSTTALITKTILEPFLKRSGKSTLKFR